MLETSGIVKGEPNAMFRIGYPGPQSQNIKKIGDWAGEHGNYHTWCEDPQSGKIYDPTPMPSASAGSLFFRSQKSPNTLVRK